MVLAIALIASAIMGVAFLVSPAEEAKPPPRRDPAELNRTLARIEGKKDITEFHLRLLHDLQEMRKGYQKPNYSLVLDLLERAAGEEILARHGRGIGPDDVKREREKYKRESKDPETLRRIIELLDRYEGMFELIYVRPIIVNQWLHRLHDTDPGIQREGRAKAEEVLKEALRDPDSLRRDWSPMAEVYQRLDSRTAGRPEEPPEIRRQQQERIRKSAKDHLSRVRPGDVRPDVVEEEGGFTIMRLIERDGEDVLFEQVTIRKSSYQSWLESELKNLKVEILDRKTEDELRANLKDHLYGRWIFGGP